MSVIKAAHSPWAEMLFDIYITRLMNKNFSGFYHFGGFPELHEIEKLVITPNHFSWWDGFFMYRYKQKFLTRRKLHLLMLESQLKRYWFFAKVGAYSIDPANPKKIINTISYTSEILNDPKNFVVIYPQGEIEPQDAERMNVKRGIVKVIEKSGEDVAVVPVAFKIVYGEEMKPAVFSACGKKFDSAAIKNSFEEYVSEMNRTLKMLSGMNYSDYTNGISY